MARKGNFEQVVTDLQVTGKSGATATPITLAGGTASGPPTSGAHVKGELVYDDLGLGWYCTVAGTPGTWTRTSRALQKDPCQWCQSVNVASLAGGAPSATNNESIVGVNVGDRILVIGQSTSTQNGIYVVQTVGTGVNGTWVRAADAVIGADLSLCAVLVQFGTSNVAGHVFAQGNTLRNIATDAQSWSDTTPASSGHDPTLYNITGDTTLTTTYWDIVSADTSSGAITVTLPNPLTTYPQIQIYHRAGANNLTVVCAGSLVFDNGATSMVIPLGGSLSLVRTSSTPAGWLIVGRNLNATPQPAIEVGIPGTKNVSLFASPTTNHLLARDPVGSDSLVDFKRVRGKELRHFKAALGNRYNCPTNIMFIGDSVCEGAGATAWTNTWNDIVRDGLQREYRNGGEGFIPPHYSAGMIWPNRAVLAGGVTETDFGSGWGRRAVFLNAVTTTITYTSYCDRFYVLYSGTTTSGTFKVTVDGVSIGTQSCASVLAAEPGRVFDSGQLALGLHTIQILPNAASNSMFIEGIMLFATDALIGVHVWNGGHGGTQSMHFNGDATEDATTIGMRRNWACQVFQPMGRQDSAAGAVTSDGATQSNLTWTGGAFDANDIGEVVFYASNLATSIPRGLRILTVTDATHIKVSGQIPAATYQMSATRHRQTDVTRVTGTTRLTSASAAFNPWDVGKSVNATGFVAGSTIRRVVDANNIDVYPGALSSGTNGTLQIINRQKLPMRPDLFNILMGGNDLFNGVPAPTFKTNMQAIVNTLIAIGNLDYPGVVANVVNDERPSVCLMNVWGTNLILDANVGVATVSGSNIVNAPTTGTITNPRFNAADIGKTFSGAPLNGLVVAAMNGAPDARGNNASCTVSGGNATATTTNTNVIMLSRQYQDSQWAEFRSKFYELSVDNDWMNHDMYNLAQNIGFSDSLGLQSYDNIHPNDRGQQWIADEYAAAVGGIKRLATIPAGIFDNPGEMVKARAADLPMKVPGILNKLTADVSNSTSATFTTIPEWAFNLPSNETLTFQFYLIFTSAIATTGMQFRLNGAAGMSTPADLVMCGVAPATSATFTYVSNITATAFPQTALIATGSAVAAVAVFQVYGSITAGAVGGLITPEWATEVNASAATLQRGSFAVVL